MFVLGFVLFSVFLVLVWFRFGCGLGWVWFLLGVCGLSLACVCVEFVLCLALV